MTTTNTQNMETCALEYKCWDCKAEPHVACSTPSGRPTKPHGVRVTRALKFVVDSELVGGETTQTLDTHRYQAEVDTKIAEYYQAHYQAREKFIGRVKTLTKKVSGSTRGWYNYTNKEGVDQLVNLDSKLRRPTHPVDVEFLYTQLVKIQELQEAYLAEEEKYTGWSRFFLVPGGHIHSSMNCSSCNKGNMPTQFSWLPELSGLDEETAVEENGPILCTVCFPSAPVEWTIGKKEEDVCPGTGTQDWVGGKPSRTGYMSGNGGTCSHCGAWASTSSQTSWNIRKHKVQ